MNLTILWQACFYKTLKAWFCNVFAVKLHVNFILLHNLIAIFFIAVYVAKKKHNTLTQTICQNICRDAISEMAEAILLHNNSFVQRIIAWQLCCNLTIENIDIIMV